MSLEPTILVKKADGTTERVPLSSIQKKKTSTAIPVPPAVSTSQTRTPTAEPSKIVSAAKPIRSDEFSDPFEPLAESNGEHPVAPATRKEDVENIFNALSFKVAPDLVGRLKTLIQSKLKDVRSVEQVAEIAERKAADGGIGLTPEQAKELIAVCMEHEVPAKNMGKPPMKNALAGMLATSTPNKGFLKKAPASSATNAPASLVKKQPVSELAPVPAPVIKPEPLRPAILSGSATKGPRTSMQDVLPVELEEVGPIDEIRLFTLVDFRRLSQNPAEAAARLGQKFVTIKEESVLQYFAALAAWRQSPLFKDYVLAVAEGLNTKKPLDVILSSTERIRPDEINALLQMEKTFVV